ncbi:unnamed protein product [Rotaria socialis]|uniref:Uncharacterized protein n=1 Tax=Rotaria socialis TaxID=392032 RepID=A0A817Y6A4_9BILA|nr:unnamed protein product [Rotaria socialis]
MNHRVVRLLANGQGDSVIIAGNENGQLGSSLSELYYPMGIYLDERNDDLYIADSWNYRIVCYSIRNAQKSGRIVAGGNGRGKHLNQLRGPQSIVLDQEGTMYIGDYGRIMRWMKGAQQGQVLIGDSSFNGWFPPSNASSNYISIPTSINFDSKNNLYFVDTLTRRILQLKLDNRMCTTDINNTTPTTTLVPNVTINQNYSTTTPHGPQCWTTNAIFTIVAQINDTHLNSTHDLTIDEKANTFYLADTYQNRLLEIQNLGSSSWTSKPISFAVPISPTALYLSRNGWLYIADETTKEIKKYRIGGPQYSLQAIAGGNGYGVESNQIANCYGLTMNEEANYLYVSDLNNHRVSRWSLKTLGEVVIVAGNSSSGSGLHQLSSPRGIHIVGGHLFISDTDNNRVVRVNLNNAQNNNSAGLLQTSIYQYNLKRPTSITSDRYGRIFYIADQSRILKWWFDQNLFEVLIDDTIADIGNEIYGLRLSEDEHYLYAVDKLNHRILKFNTMITKCSK